MSKRASFSPRDDWETIDYRAVDRLIPYLTHIQTFAEPCCGGGKLVDQLESYGLKCVYRHDIKFGRDALKLTHDTLEGADAIITNPPWTRKILHPLIEHFVSLVTVPVWLLFDADWAFNQGSHKFLMYCSHIVPVGRLRWVPGTKTQGKDNVAWYRFHAAKGTGPRLFPRP